MIDRGGLVFSCDEVRVRSSMGHKRSYNDLEIVTFRGQKSTGTWVDEANEFKFEVRSDLRGHLEAAMASEATSDLIFEISDLNYLC